MPTNEDARAGFTLLEALVALAILAGTVGSVMTIIATNRAAQARADLDYAAALHVRTILARIGRDMPLEAGMQSGVFEDGQTWSVRIEPYNEDGLSGRAQGQLFYVSVRLQGSGPFGSSTNISTLKRASSW